MRNFLMASAAAIAVAAFPAFASAQDMDDDMMAEPTDSPATVPGSTNSVDDKRGDNKMTAEQTTMYESWPEDRRTDYDTWPAEQQVYYWELVPDQREGYWALTADQRGRLYAMTPAQRQAAWQSIMAQMNGQTPPTPANQANPPGQGVPTTGVPNPQAANQAVQPAMPADPSYQGGPYKGAATPPPADAMNKEYPICGATVQDSCINPREAGKNYGNRPLKYWPGKPASEM